MAIRKILCGAAAAVLLGFGPAAAQDHAAHDKQDKLMKGSSVAIEGCVTTGENDDTFVLSAVREIPGRPVETGLRRVYWLDDEDDLEDNVGKVVRVEGRIDGIEEGKLDVKPGKAVDGGTLVEIEGPGRDVDTTPAALSVGTSGAAADAPKPSVTLIRLDVDKVTALRACGSAGL